MSLKKALNHQTESAVVNVVTTDKDVIMSVNEESSSLGLISVFSHLGLFALLEFLNICTSIVVALIGFRTKLKIYTHVSI